MSAAVNTKSPSNSRPGRRRSGGVVVPHAPRWFQRVAAWIIYSALPGSAIALLLNRKIDPNFGKKTG